jgi:hypothetical protein
MVVAQRPILSVDNPQNRYTLNEEGYYFTSFDQVQKLLDNGDDLNRFIPSIKVCERYNWERIVKEYESCY